MFICQACLQAPVQSWIYQALELLWERGELVIYEQSPASRQVEVCISFMTIMQQFWGQAQKKHISWLLAGEAIFKTT